MCSPGIKRKKAALPSRAVSAFGLFGIRISSIDIPSDLHPDLHTDDIPVRKDLAEPNLLEQIAYRDTWGRGVDSFIGMIYERLIRMRDLLHDCANNLRRRLLTMQTRTAFAATFIEYRVLASLPPLQ